MSHQSEILNLDNLLIFGAKKQTSSIVRKYYECTEKLDLVYQNMNQFLSTAC